jgi:SDR family mycofactocin-dependent oxidoreductase
MGRMAGKVALITGAARGQGRSHAVRLAAEGASIVALDLCADLVTVPYELAAPADLDETVRLVGEVGGTALARKADVRDSAQLAAVVADALEQFGHIDVVCANAGIFSNAPVTELTDEMWDDMIGINLTGVFRTVRAVLPSMISRRAGGSIILTSSTAGARGFANFAHYTAAKHGVIGLMRSLVNEVSRYRIRVNALLPTSVDTGMIQNENMYRLFDPDNPAPDRESFARAHASLNALPVGWIEPADVSAAVAWLASDEARYVTGVMLPVDAGFIEKVG